jgi:signal transduction histidine kinase
MKDKNNTLVLLRQKAEDLIAANKNGVSNSETLEVKRIFHELQLYQLEMEMQNDELQLTTIELEQQRIKFANLFDLAPIGYFVINQSAVILDVNHAGLNLLKYDKSFLLNKPLLLNIYQEDRDNFYKFIRQLFSSGITQTCQLRLTNSKKQVLNVQVEGIAISMQTDAMCCLTVADLTHNIQAEIKLKEAQQRLQIAMNASLTGIWEIDVPSGKVFLDDFCCSLYGFEPGTFDEKYTTLLASIHPFDQKTVDFSIRQTIVEEKEFNIRFRSVLPNQQIKYIQARAQVVTQKEGKKRFIGTFTDISEKTGLELEAVRIKEQQQQMILAAGLQAEENEKKRISEVLHNGIAQMLYAIKLNIDQVKKSSAAPVFEQVTELLQQSIKDIRNISFELAPSILTDFGLGATLEDMAARLSNEQLHIITKVNHVSKNLEFQLQLNIFRIIQELVNNAIKHAFASEIIIEITQKTKTITITVADNGIGFKPQNNTEVPSGIGLSSIKNRLRLYRGTLHIEPQLQGGTIVTISLKH